VKRFALPAVLVLASALFALVLAEMALRVVGFSAPIWHQPDAQLGWKLRPGIAAWFTKEGRAFVRTNAQGARDRDHALHKPEDVYRIAVLGDMLELGTFSADAHEALGRDAARSTDVLIGIGELARPGDGAGNEIAVHATVDDPELDRGIDATPTTPEQFAAYIKRENDKWVKIIKAVGIKPE